VPIGPFLLDPLFAETDEDLPRPEYDAALRDRWRANPGAGDAPRLVWVVRTNQGQVDGGDTLGLDFFFPAFS
jgi:hypothetical protein